MPVLEKEPSLFPRDLLSSAAECAADKRWWAVFTKARQEKALARELLADDIPFYLPLVAHDRRVRGRRRTSYLPLFSGYLFLYASEPQRLHCLRTSRVVRMLDVPDPGQLVADLRQVNCLIESEAPLMVEKRLSPGQHVRIKDGPMMGLEGTVTARRGKTHLLVAVRFLNSGVSVQIDDYRLEPL